MDESKHPRGEETDDDPSRRTKRPKAERELPLEHLVETRWATDPLRSKVTSAEYDEVLGWATHVTAPFGDSAATFQPLVGLPDVPPPNSFLQLVDAYASQQCTKEQLKTFDISALVTMGICLEEMLTVSFLPLAQKHVERCRQLSDEDAFRAWTLPPEEAIAELIGSSCDFSEVALPTATAAHRTILTEDELRAYPKKIPLVRPSKEDRESLDWCRSRFLRSQLVRQNMDVYGCFLASTPPDDPDSRRIVDKDTAKVSTHLA